MEILRRAVIGDSLTFDEGLKLYLQAPYGEIAAAAHERRCKVSSDDVVTWQIDRNVNITNVCVSGCKFCNFHCKLHETERSFITTIDEYLVKIDEMVAMGGDQLLLQGGLHPKLDINYYETLFRELKHHYPGVRLHALGPPEIVHIARISGISCENTLQRLITAGLDSLPGAGAEILNSNIRRRISPQKASAEQWLEVMGIAHKMNLPTSATMMYGHVESVDDRIDHLIKLRDQQTLKPKGSYGFIAFIPWVFCAGGTILEQEGISSLNSASEYLRIVAISRLMLNNITNIQASWLTVGTDVASLSLNGGANDMGSIMIEENVVSSAGADNKLNSDSMREVIRRAGFTPVLRDQYYNRRDESFLEK